ncbi:MAG: hypothetical protein RLZZ174_1413, partial [Pseudomonadota bacterium]
MSEPPLGAAPRALRSAGLAFDPFLQPGLWPEGQGYLDAVRARMLRLLGTPEEYGAPLLLLLGVRGLGKTTLLEAAAARLPSPWTALLLRTQGLGSESELLIALAGALGLDLDSERPTAVRWRELEDELGARQQIGSRLLLAVDDADQLGEDALAALLSHLQPLQGEALRILLTAPPAFEETFDAL